MTAVACVGATEGDASAASARVPFQEVVHGSRASNLRGESMRTQGRVLRNRPEALRVLRAWGLDPAAARSVNFHREKLIVVLVAYQPSGGYRARVSRVVVEGRQAVVTATARHEGGKLATQALERPWVVVAVKRRLAGVRSEVRVRMA